MQRAGPMTSDEETPVITAAVIIHEDQPTTQTISRRQTSFGVIANEVRPNTQTSAQTAAVEHSARDISSVI